MQEGQYIGGQSPEEIEEERLAKLESRRDPITIRRMKELGVRPGWWCLEVGAGADQLLDGSRSKSVLLAMSSRPTSICASSIGFRVQISKYAAIMCARRISSRVPTTLCTAGHSRCMCRDRRRPSAAWQKQCGLEGGSSSRSLIMGALLG